ncbi:MAG: Membrane protein [Parcubacteria group bacterium]|nr:Membrane protein [Parcubacteria group bacterium]
MNEIYFYLVGSLIYFIIWIVLFLKRPDLRKEILVVSFLFGFAGLITAPIHLATWWHPLTITRTSVGIEDFIFGFSASGIAAVLYEEIYRKRLAPANKHTLAKGGLFFLIAFALLFFFFVYTVGLNAFYALLYSYLIGIGCIAFYRRDLMYSSFSSGLLMLFLSVGVYALLLYLFPNAIRDFWYLSGTWYQQLLFGIPVEEYLFFFLTGAFIGPLYEFVTDSQYI